MDEITWCGNDGRFARLKLHLANFQIDLRNKEYVQQLADVIRADNRYELAIVIPLGRVTRIMAPKM